MRWLFVAAVAFFAVAAGSNPINQWDVCTVIQAVGDYPCEHHTAQTLDGWTLSLQRIPPKVTPPRGVVLYQHGLVDCAVGLCLGQPGLPYILHDQGFDVWLGNNRGNGVSMTYNGKQDVHDAAFWNFTFDEMAEYDLPATISAVLAATQATNLTYIGHSEGTTQAFAGFLNPAVAAKVNLFVALAPVAYVNHCKSLILDAMAKLHYEAILQLFGNKGAYLPSIIESLFPGICKLEPSLCLNVMNAIMGPSTYLNATRLPYILHYEPNPTSVKNLAHWAQAVRSKVFQKFDYGTQGNMKHYNQKTPPVYDLTKMPATLPIALFSGGKDDLGDPKDVQRLVNDLPVPPTLWHDEPDYAHMDFLWSVNAYERIYPLIIDLIAKHQGSN